MSCVPRPAYNLCDLFGPCSHSPRCHNPRHARARRRCVDVFGAFSNFLATIALSSVTANHEINYLDRPTDGYYNVSLAYAIRSRKISISRSMCECELVVYMYFNRYTPSRCAAFFPPDVTIHFLPDMKTLTVFFNDNLAAMRLQEFFITIE